MMLLALMLAFCAPALFIMPFAFWGGAGNELDYSCDFEAGSNQYAHAATSGYLDAPGSEMSLELCVKFESLPTSGNSMYFIWHVDVETAGYNFRLYNDSGTYRLSAGFQRSGGNVVGTAAWTPSTGVWYRVGVSTWDAGALTKIQFFVDGATEDTEKGSVTQGDLVAATSDLYLACCAGGGISDYFDGKMADVRIWLDRRTNQEMSDNAWTLVPSDADNLGENWWCDDANTGYLDEEVHSGQQHVTVNTPVRSTDVPF